MKILVAGATGATGRLLVEQLLERGHDVKAIVRSPGKLSALSKQYDRLSLMEAAILDLSDAEMAEYVRDCDAVASCLGHNVSLKGIYGGPRRLVTDAVRRLCHAIKVNQPEKKIKYVLMNTVACRNRDLVEPLPLGHRMVIGLLRWILPPHVDNEQAVDFLRVRIGQNDPVIEWAAVRPDSLIDDEEVTEYDIHPSPIRSGIFDPGKTSRINVAHFMTELITNDDTWKEWRGRMPVIYNRESAG